MVNPNLPAIPPALNSVKHYLMVAANHELDPVVSYWCRLYALQTGLKLSTKTAEVTNFLLKLMDLLEATKKELGDNEAITNDVVAHAHLENWALKLFLCADKNDRSGDFSKKTIQCFFTAGLLYDVLTVFGQPSEEEIQKGKYAKWKATYIHNCLRNGETPIPGPIEDNMEDFDSVEADVGARSQEKPEKEEEESLDSNKQCNTGNIGEVSPEIGGDCCSTTKTVTEGGINLSLYQINKAQKFIKWAGSALNYDDVPTAVLNLRKAINLLTTGEEED